MADATPAALLAHPVACHCAGQGSDQTCPTRWNGLVGATNCDIRRPHKGHEWFGPHPFRIAIARMRCRGVSRRPRVTLRFAWYDLWVGVFVDTAKRTVYICPLPCVLVTVRRG